MALTRYTRGLAACWAALTDDRKGWGLVMWVVR